MSVECVQYKSNVDIRFAENIAWSDPDTDCSVVLSQPDTDPPFGVMEMKTPWVSDNRASQHAITNLLARTAYHATSVMGVQFVMATAAQHVLELWKCSGGVVAPIPATPHPDGRYRTKMMWWDRRTMVNHSQPEQITKALPEIDAISTRLVAG